MCYADFASQYVTGSNPRQDNDSADAVNINEKRSTITLQIKLGIIYHLKTPHFIRFHAIPRSKDPEGYCHRLLMMYLSWRIHEELKYEGSYEKKLLMVSAQIQLMDITGRTIER